MSKKEFEVIDQPKKKSGMGKFLAGAAIGAGLGILFAPRKGSETRRILKEKMDYLINQVKNIDMDEVKEAIEEKIEELKEELADLDKEKVLQLAQDKANQIKEKANDLVELAVEKGTPVLQKAADDVRQQAIKVVKEVLKKLEKTEK